MSPRAEVKHRAILVGAGICSLLNGLSRTRRMIDGSVLWTYMGNRRSPIIQDPARGRCIFGCEPYGGIVWIDARAGVIAPSRRRNRIGIIAGAANREIGQHIRASCHLDPGIRRWIPG